MPRIQQLPESVITKIAAGEVIERPASVVKELLENSVDAGARRIDVDVEQGGTELIRVVDDGCGIAADDLQLAFASHATSKLTNADDLFQIGTLGFRGEALASIGGVAQVTLQSRQADQLAGAEISCNGSTLTALRPWNGAPGTRIEVRHLFYNTPVRRKFMRTTATEMGHLCETFTRLALAKPGLHMTLRHGGKHVYEVPATANLQERLGLFFGPEVQGKLYPIEANGGPAHLYGFVADPSCERGNAKMQYLFLNGRWIRDRSLGHALQESYRGLVMTGRYPVAFLFIELPADLVDVNVHPTKSEVRFRDGNGLYSLLLNTIRQRLSTANLTPRLQAPSTLGGPRAPLFAGTQTPTGGLPPPTVLPPEQPQDHRGPATPIIGLESSRNTPSAVSPATDRQQQTPVLIAAVAQASDQPLPSGDKSSHYEQTGPAASQALDQQPRLLRDVPVLKAIQLYNAYLVLETQDGMLVIDQHALHERILFEQFKKRIRAGTLETQQLLIPEPVELTAEQAARTLEQWDALAELGLGVQDFGGGTVLLTSYPAMLGNRNPQKVLKAVVDHLTSKDRVPTREQLLSDLLSLMACHAAVRSGDPLTPEEITALVEQREMADDTHHCPHGRPTSLLFTRHDLDRQFRRV
jgi:DNA mismatch repair protein MutL